MTENEWDQLKLGKSEAFHCYFCQFSVWQVPVNTARPAKRIYPKIHLIATGKVALHLRKNNHIFTY